MVNVGFCLIVSVLGQTRPVTEVTIEKQAALSASLQSLGSLAELLAKLDDPAIRQPGEETHDYFQRVERIFKIRAYLLLKLQHEYERALENKYALEADLQHFDDYVSAKEDRNRENSRRQADFLNRLTEKEDRLRMDARYLANNLELQLRREAKTLRASGSPEDSVEADALEQRAERLYAFAKFSQFGDESEYKQRFADLQTTAQIEAKLTEIFGEVKLAKFEQNYVKYNLMDEFAEVTRLLDEAQLESIDAAKSLLEDDRVFQLELRARKVAIMSRHMQGQLEELRRKKEDGDIVDVRGALYDSLRNEGRVRDFVQLITGANFEPTLDDWAELLEQDVKARNNEPTVSPAAAAAGG